MFGFNVKENVREAVSKLEKSNNEQKERLRQLRLLMKGKDVTPCIVPKVVISSLLSRDEVLALAAEEKKELTSVEIKENLKNGVYLLYEDDIISTPIYYKPISYKKKEKWVPAGFEVAFPHIQYIIRNGDEKTKRYMISTVENNDFGHVFGGTIGGRKVLIFADAGDFTGTEMSQKVEIYTNEKEEKIYGSGNGRVYKKCTPLTDEFRGWYLLEDICC